MKDIYKLNFDTGKVRPKVVVSQFDNGLRQIVFELYNNDDVFIPTSATIELNGIITPTIEDNQVSFIVDTSLTQTVGKYEGEVRCGMGTVNFDFIVEETPAEVFF